jgi:hypothetical protein
MKWRVEIKHVGGRRGGRGKGYTATRLNFGYAKVGVVQLNQISI